MQYEVQLNGQRVGSAAVSRQGLYYRIQFHCRLPDDQIYCLKVSCRERITDLGTCIPVRNGFAVNTSVSVKQIGEGELSFFVERRYEDRQETFYEVRADKPFAYIRKLQQARLRRKGDIVGVVFIPPV